VTDLTTQAAETIDSLREQLAAATARAGEAEAEAERQRMFWESIRDARVEAAESSLATARREAQEARDLLRRTVLRGEWTNETHNEVRRALASPEAPRGEFVCVYSSGPMPMSARDPVASAPDVHLCVESGHGYAASACGAALDPYDGWGADESPEAAGYTFNPERVTCPACSRAVSPEAHDETRPDPEWVSHVSPAPRGPSPSAPTRNDSKENR
jgi:hypothetical protein